MPYHNQDMAKRFHQTDVKGGMSATRYLLQHATASVRRQQASSSNEHTPPRHYARYPTSGSGRRFNEAERYGSYDDFRDSAVASH
ncbi:hypothetical protein ACNKHM_07060 [Shigella sonnei]